MLGTSLVSLKRSDVDPVMVVLVMFGFGFLSVSLVAQRLRSTRLTRVVFTYALVVMIPPAFVPVTFLVVGYAGTKLV
jgi:hypothetical protein